MLFLNLGLTQKQTLHVRDDQALDKIHLEKKPSREVSLLLISGRPRNLQYLLPTYRTLICLNVCSPRENYKSKHAYTFYN
jgi:hypothetical protein